MRRARNLPIKATPALYSEDGDTNWTEVEIIGRHKSGRPVLREVGKFWPGIWVADWRNVAVFMASRGAA